MKRNFFYALVFGILFSAITWLVGVLLSERLFDDHINPTVHLDDELLSDIAADLDGLSADPAEDELMVIGENYDVILMLLDDESLHSRERNAGEGADKTNNPTYSRGAGLPDSGGRSDDNESAEGVAAISAEKGEDRFSEGEWYVNSEYPDSLEYERPDGLVFAIEYYGEQPFLFSASQWFQLLLQLVALSLALVFFYLLVRLKLNELDSISRQSPLLKSPSGDPVSNAIDVLGAANSSLLSNATVRNQEATRHRDLLASVAHEFRNPLARVQFANEMAIDAQPEERRKLLEQSNAAALELDVLVRETLSYSRLSTPATEITRTNVSINDVFRQLEKRNLTTNSAAASEYGEIEFSVTYPDDDVLINAEQKLLVRALENLISNAHRYAKSKVILSVSGEHESEDVIILSVWDDGPGIDAIHHERLFEPFYRIEPSRSRATGGFGLGLSIVKSICEKHAAQVQIQSNGQQGTRFLMIWPRISAHSKSAG